MERYRIKCFWGNTASNMSEDLTTIEQVLDTVDNGYDIETVEFDTEAEVQAFIKGVERMDGWSSYNLIEI